MCDGDDVADDDVLSEYCEEQRFYGVCELWF
jgi:hypothetical protein